jgi:hypothetical protein
MNDPSHLGAIIVALHDSDIYGTVSWLHRDIWHVILSDPNIGILAETAVETPQAAAEWLRANAIRLYPDSVFAQWISAIERSGLNIDWFPLFL